MHMSYWFGVSVGDLLFKGYTITSVSGLVSTCFGLASLAVLFEALKVQQVCVKQKSLTGHTRQTPATCPNESTCLLAGAPVRGPVTRQMTRAGLISLLHQVLWYILQDVLGYIIMLCVMTYNGYFTLSVCIGAGLGFFVFGPQLTELGMGNIHPRDCPLCIEKTKKLDNPSSSSCLMFNVADEMVQSMGSSESAILQCTTASHSAENHVSSVAIVHHINEDVQ